MSLISRVIPNLINGVSQQPPEVRLPSQAEEQINLLSSVVEGLKRRPGTQHLAELLSNPTSGAYVHIINRDLYEKYVAVFIDGDVRVFDFQGNERLVNKPSGTDYLKAFAPGKSIRAVTVADYSFILNKERVARAYDPNEGLELVPVTQRFQTLTFRFPQEAARYFTVITYNEGRVVSTQYNRRRSLTYQITVNGQTFSKAGNENISETVTYFSSVLSKALNRPCVVSGASLEIPLNDGETGFTFTDSSTITALSSGRDYYPGTRYLIEWAPVDASSMYERYTEVGVGGISTTTSAVTSRIVGYASADGDAIPEGEVTNKEGIVFVRQGDYGTTYRVFVDGAVRASVTTSTTDRASIGTETIAASLHSQLSTAGLTNILVSIKGNVILLRATDTTTDFNLSVSDSAGGKHLLACKGRVQSFTDLPATCFEGFNIKVAGQDGVEADDYYVQYTEFSNGEKTSGTWKEVAKKGLRTRPAPATMPHRLISNADGSFTFEPIEWDGRTAGDEESAPEPSFINKAISDIFFFKNRLGFLAEENIIFSESGSYYNFYPTTVLQSLDTHPIDYAVTNDKVSLLRHAVPFNEALLLFSDQTQFILRSGDRLTKETVTVDVTTRFEAALEAKPVGAGKNVFFGVKRGPWSGLREYYVDPDTQVNDAADVASHCPEYIYGSITTLAASSNEDMVLAVTDTSPDTLYVYKYYWQGNEKVQSSWSKWVMAGNILGCSFVDSDIALVIERNGKVYLERISLATTNDEQARGFKTELCLDRKTFVPAGQPFPWASTNQVAVDQKGNILTGEALEQAHPGAVATADLYIGERFRSYYQFSQLVITDGETRIAPLVGRLQLRFMTLNYVDSGFFSVGVKAGTRPEQVNAFTGRRIGSAANKLGTVPIDSGRYRFPLLGQAPETDIWIESDSHLPCAFLSAEWEALYFRQSRRV